MRSWPLALLVPILAGDSAVYIGAAAPQDAGTGKTHEAADDNNTAKIYNGFKRYHAGCNHCHGQDGNGSSFGPSLVERLPDIEAFRHVVRYGSGKGTRVMKGFAGNPNVEPYIDDIYAYLRARAEGRLGRGRRAELER